MKDAKKRISLAGNWLLNDEDISFGREKHNDILKSKDWVEVSIPGDIHSALINSDRMKEPLEGLNSLEGHWIEERSWWLLKRFRSSPQLLESKIVELYLDGLDYNASIFLNGQHLGDHSNVFRPFICRIKQHLIPGENELLVRLITGIEKYSVKEANKLKGFIPTEDINQRPERGDRRRVFARKPVYTWGWDWAPRVPTVGIMKNAQINMYDYVQIQDINVKYTGNPKKVELDIEVNVEWFEPYKASYRDISLTIFDPEGKLIYKSRVKKLLQTGYNYFNFETDIKKPRLWWPAGVGHQDRYFIVA